LWVEDRYRADLFASSEGRGEVVGTRARGENGAWGVEDHGYGQVETLAGTWRPDHDHGVLDRGVGIDTACAA
jgi:hypothetical protein